MGIESSDEMASFLGSQYLLYNQIETLDEILKKYKSITLEDIKTIAQQILQSELIYTYHIQ